MNMKIRYLDPLERLEYELRQLHEEGWDMTGYQLTYQKLVADSDDHIREKAFKILKEMYHHYTPLREKKFNLHRSEGISFPQPEQDGMQSAAGLQKSNELYDKILGGWTGRAAGCLLGKPVEKYSRQIIREILESNHTWPLNHYFTAKGMPESVLKKYPWKQRGGFESLRENIVCMPEDDDLNYTMLNLYVTEKYGKNFTSENVGESWLQMLPVYETFTAERVAYYNLLSGVSPPESGRYLNPFREWIGAQIRADLWGYINPGNPDQAADMAYRDACISHTGNGLYAEMFFASIIAAAFVEKSPEKLIQIGLSRIPEQSRLSQAIQFTLDVAKTGQDWETIVDRLYAELGYYHWVHTINNAALTVAALLYGQGDYEKTICHAVMGGWDTDCNGATAGSIVGVIQGHSKLPDKWIRPLNNRIRSGVKGFDNLSFTELARRTLNVTIKTSVKNKKMEKMTYQDDF
ncbi:MAG: ADP-ribosylglycohydrolase family protein [Fidelibacterota bacterium]